jgi:ABC-type uncharacterized transport system involved in gliding motility auxiliary subunit
MFRYEFVDPVSEETEEDKEKKKEVKHDIFGRAVREATSIERELQSLGIPPVQVRVNEDDKIEVKRAYMGLAIKYGDDTEVIPLVRETVGLEYDITSLIRKLTREKTPKLAFVTSLDAQAFQQTYGRLNQLLSQTYEVSTLDLATTPEIADDIEAIIILAGKQPYTQEQIATIDEYVMSGRSAAFLLDAVKPHLDTMMADEVEHGLGDLLATYGVKIGEGLIIDKECATISVSQRRGFMTISQPVPYPFMPLPKSLDPDHPLTRGLAQVAFPFMAPLELSLPEGSEVKGDILVRSSAVSYVQKPPYNLDPFQRWQTDAFGESKSRPLVITLAGPIRSHTMTEPVEAESVSTPPEDGVVATRARVLVAGGASFASDQFMSKTNEAFLLNLMDWLLLDEDLLAVRSRGLAAAPLGTIDEEGNHQEVSDGVRRSARYFNIAGVPLVFIGFGVIRWRLREARRDKVKI